MRRPRHRLQVRYGWRAIAGDRDLYAEGVRGQERVDLHVPGLPREHRGDNGQVAESVDLVVDADGARSPSGSAVAIETIRRSRPSLRNSGPPWIKKLPFFALARYYALTTVEQLLKDFLAECELLGWRKGDEADSR